MGLSVAALELTHIIPISTTIFLKKSLVVEGLQCQLKKDSSHGSEIIGIYLPIVGMTSS